MSLPADYDFKPFKRDGHKWLCISWDSRSVEICIDGWFDNSHGPDISCHTFRGWLARDKFSYYIDSIGNCVMDFPTCFGYQSVHTGKLCVTGGSHSTVIILRCYLESIFNII